MATTNILRSLEAASIFPRTEEVFIASATITAGQVVALDYDAGTDAEVMLKVLPGINSDATALDAVGVALEGAAAGERIRVAIAGICEANVSTSVSAGDRLILSSVSGEYLTFNGTHAFPVLAIALEDDAAGVATVRVFRTF